MCIPLIPPMRNLLSVRSSTSLAKWPSTVDGEAATTMVSAKMGSVASKYTCVASQAFRCFRPHLSRRPLPRLRWAGQGRGH